MGKKRRKLTSPKYAKKAASLRKAIFGNKEEVATDPETELIQIEEPSESTPIPADTTGDKEAETVVKKTERKQTTRKKSTTSSSANSTTKSKPKTKTKARRTTPAKKTAKA